MTRRFLLKILPAALVPAVVKATPCRAAGERIRFYLRDWPDGFSWGIMDRIREYAQGRILYSFGGQKIFEVRNSSGCLEASIEAYLFTPEGLMQFREGNLSNLPVTRITPTGAYPLHRGGEGKR